MAWDADWPMTKNTRMKAIHMDNLIDMVNERADFSDDLNGTTNATVAGVVVNERVKRSSHNDVRLRMNRVKGSYHKGDPPTSPTQTLTITTVQVNDRVATSSGNEIYSLGNDMIYLLIRFVPDQITTRGAIGSTDPVYATALTSAWTAFGSASWTTGSVNSGMQTDVLNPFGDWKMSIDEWRHSKTWAASNDSSAYTLVAIYAKFDWTGTIFRAESLTAELKWSSTAPSPNLWSDPNFGASSATKLVTPGDADLYVLSSHLLTNLDLTGATNYFLHRMNPADKPTPNPTNTAGQFPRFALPSNLAIKNTWSFAA